MSHRKPVTGLELRQILDAYIRNLTPRQIAQDRKRTEKAIESLLIKIASNYTEDGERTSLILKLAGVGCTLHPQRQNHSFNEMKLFRTCYKRNRSLAEMVLIFHLRPSELCQMEATAFGATLRPYKRLRKEWSGR